MKKYFKKAIAAIAAATMTLSLSITSMAAVFPDVTEETYPWALEAIESMAEEGIIKGYETGKFEPAKTVSKLESLVLVSRILGFYDSDNESLASAAWDIYGDAIDKYELNFGQKEVAFLMVKGVLSADELDEYLSEHSRNDGLKRYEVAVVLTKALNAVSELTNESVDELSFEDNSDIPANAKKYVAYMVKIGLMKGMDGNRFAPNESVTRAQAALMLYNMQAMTDYTYAKGIVSSFDQTTRNIKLKAEDDEILSISASSGTILRYKGESIGINDVSVGYDALVTYKKGVLYSIDFTDAMIDEVVYGSYVGSSKSTAKGTTVNVKVLGKLDADIANAKQASYKVSDDCIVTYNDITCTLATLKAGYYVKLTVKQGIVTVIEAKAYASKLSGRVNKVIFDPAYMLSIEDNDGNVKEYLVASDVTVKKNGGNATARDVLEGDSVSLGLSYDRITAITATSKVTNKTGIIKEVIISETPRITILVGGEEVSYAITNTADIKIGESSVTFYDLRVGMAVEYKLESDTVVSLKTTSVSTVTTLEGTVQLVNASFKLIQLQFVDDVTGETRTENIYVNDKASIVDYSSQKDVKLSTIKAGNVVSVTGSLTSGIFEARNIVVIK